MATNERTMPDPPVETASAGELIRDGLATVRDLWSKELQLARAETREALDALKAAALCVLLAAIPALVSLVLIALALTYALDDYLPQWAAALVPAVVLALLSIGMLVFGARRLKGPDAAPDQTIQNLKEDKQWLKQELSGR
jgi:uncharacterized membrane protein YqjE